MPKIMVFVLIAKITKINYTYLYNMVDGGASGGRADQGNGTDTADGAREAK